MKKHPAVSPQIVERMKISSFIRCVTSRYICFPILFAITSVSLIATMVQFSYERSSALRLDRPSRSLQLDDMSWIRTIPERRERINHAGKKSKAENILENMNNINVESLPKMELPLHIVKGKKTKPNSNQAPLSIAERANTLTPNVGRVLLDSGHSAKEKHSSSSSIDSHNSKKVAAVQFNKINRGIPNKISNVARKMSKSVQSKLKAILIVTNYRSGSTFLGELFNQHPDAFYSFEPLYPFGSNCSFELERRVKVLHDMLKCKFPSMTSLFEDIGKDPEMNPGHISCVRNNFCFRYNHPDLCANDTCPNGNRISCMKCGPVDLRIVKNKCRSRKVAVIKVIRLCYINDFKSLFDDPYLDLKVIHLVRDPRGIASSRLKIHPNWDIVENVRSTCYRQVSNVKAGRNENWLMDKYKLVRYEDLATRPLELASEIYEFAGIRFAESVRKWILQNTQSRVKTKTSIREKILAQKLNGTYDLLSDPYATQRDSRAAMQAWRNRLPLNVTDKIQKHCFESLRSLGYYDFKTVSELLNLNISSIL